MVVARRQSGLDQPVPAAVVVVARLPPGVQMPRPAVVMAVVRHLLSGFEEVVRLVAVAAIAARLPPEQQVTRSVGIAVA